LKVNRIAERLNRIFFKMRFRGEPISFFSLVDNFSDCLVCMPSNMRYILEASSKLPDIAAIFPNRMIKVLLTSNIDPGSYAFVKRFSIIKPYSYDLNMFYLPKKSFIEKVVGKGLSVCIDLDLEHNYFNSSICALTRAPIRVGSKKGLGLPYYNLEINVGDPETPAKEQYDNFVKVLYNFKSEGDRIASIET
jgi:hypothetical protein